MDDFLDTVARALHETDPTLAAWERMSEGYRDLCRMEARAAIGAMLEMSRGISVADFYFFMGRAAKAPAPSPHTGTANS